MPVEVGDKAPDFTLRSHTGKLVRLNDYLKEGHVVLQVLVSAFTKG